LRTSLVAVPALRRVEPVSTSGPTMGLTITSHVSAKTFGGVEQVTRIVLAPSVWARASALRTYGVVPLAAMPTTTSRFVTAAVSIAAPPAFTSSSAPSALLTSAGYPPAITPTTSVGGTPNGGGHSVAPSTPRRRGGPLGRVAPAEAAGSPRPDVNQPPTGPKRRHDQLDRGRDALTFAVHDLRNGSILAIHQVHDLETGGYVDALGTPIALLGGPRIGE